MDLKLPEKPPYIFWPLDRGRVLLILFLLVLLVSYALWGDKL